MKKKTGIIVCMIVAIFGIWQSLNQLVLFQEYDGFRYYRLEEKVSMETATLIQMTKAEEMPDMILWDFSDNQTVRINTPVERESKASVVTICGNPEYLVGNFSIPQYGDTENCLLDGRTALELFGTREAVGEIVIYQGKNYKIKGILDGVDPTLVIQASADYDGGFECMTVADNSEMGDWELENRILNRYGIVLKKSDWGMVRTAVKLLFCGMTLSVYSLVVKKLYRYKKSKKCLTNRIIMGVCMLGGTLFFGVLLWTTGVREVSTEYIPSQWSDFGFYKKIWNSIGDAFKNLLRINLSTFELRILQNSIILCLNIILVGLTVRYLITVLCDTSGFQMNEKTIQKKMGGLSSLEEKTNAEVLPSCRAVQEWMNMTNAQLLTSDLKPFNLATVCLDIYDELCNVLRKEGYLLHVDPEDAFEVSVIIDSHLVHLALCTLFHAFAIRCEKGTELFISSRKNMVILEGISISALEIGEYLNEEEGHKKITEKDGIKKAVQYILMTGGQVKILSDHNKEGIGVII